jgi:hypothetical protein
MYDLPVIGYGLLVSVASQKRWGIGYGEVYDIVGARLGWPQRWNGHGWCGPVKGICCEAARINRLNGEPLLASLVRRKDGSIGDGYVTAVEIRYGVTEAAKLTTDAAIQAHADAERAKCWAYFELTV